ncbi:helix-turn-helix domain-containing protein [Flavobacterium litorale]|uniref:Helix-turn-helix transcriptional regulator n=1 Tax=Flavobacterium litorale TaxID=2856519 RepID=A0ABX8V7Y3_9FLAO|nr:helix-turn-helix domain-containing protein [Flavobacterium litorale]QYJ68932.1 helix-turn-helix transcriptional regulator [Flavobacterium litorale]
MMNKTNIQLLAKANNAFLTDIGIFVKYYRLEQNKTQEQLAEEAGINRVTLGELERGGRSKILTLIQVLRALDKLEVLNVFIVEQKISPLKLAKIERESRQRASGKRSSESKSDW